MLVRSVTMLLLRHGQSEWNAAGRWQGTADSPLTDLGRQQARQIGALLAAAGMPISNVWSSDLERASRTASIIGEILGLEVTTDPLLREAHAGEWEGMTAGEIARDWPGHLEQHLRPPGFETFESVVARALAGLRAIAAAGDESDGIALVIAHTGLMRAIRRHLGAEEGRIPNLGGTWLTIHPPAIDPDSSTSDPLDTSGIAVGDVFDPAGIAVTGVDIHGEDPGHQADQPEADRTPEQ
jgi:probable phosphoglycerate mutase